MRKTKFLVSYVTYGLDLVVFKDKETVWTKQVIRKKESVVSRYKHLISSFEQSFTNLV